MTHPTQVETQYDTCPHCGHDIIEITLPDIGQGWLTQDKYCEACGTKWSESYVFSHSSELREFNHDAPETDAFPATITKE